MNALVLATILVYGLSDADGGEVNTADVGEVCVDFGGEWEVTVRLPPLPGTSWKTTYQERLRERLLFWEEVWGNQPMAELIPEGPGRVCIVSKRLVSEREKGRIVRKGGERFPGIYRLVGGEIHICTGDEGRRPTDFRIRRDPLQMLLILKRPEPAKPKK
jgi:hypothetical protein